MQYSRILAYCMVENASQYINDDLLWISSGMMGFNLNPGIGNPRCRVPADLSTAKDFVSPLFHICSGSEIRGAGSHIPLI